LWCCLLHFKQNNKDLKWKNYQSWILPLKLQ
jgi:hypothetical protein